ncbi:MAG: polyprenyl synthetase family protein [Anaerolineales bacterium]|jgi:geranylgeranyl diphosphate synthase type I
MSREAESSFLIDEMLDAVEEDLRALHAELLDHTYQAMAEMIAYHLGWTDAPSLKTGKRLRPLTTLLTCQAAGGDWRQALPAASCVELIHNFSLVHDDIQDSSELRRGRPSLWHRWGVPQAINAGDALFVLAHLSMLRLRQKAVAPEVVIKALTILDQASLQLTRGQHLDIAFEGQESVSQAQYLHMIEGKTGSLLAAAAEIGSLIGEASPEVTQAYRMCGLHLGLTFQIVDDILGIWGSVEVVGKQTGDDLRSRKKTLPVILGLQRSPIFAKLWSSKATSHRSLVRMTKALEEAGCLSHTRTIAQRHTDLAIEALHSAKPEKQAGALLEQLAIQLLHREH